MKKTKGLVFSIIAALALIGVPLSVTAVLRTTLKRSEAEIDQQAATSTRIPVEADTGTEDEQFYEKYLPEIAGGVTFAWIASVLLFLGLKRKKENG